MASLSDNPEDRISPWWIRTVLITLVVGFAVLILITQRGYENAPPIPAQAVDPAGATVFTGDDVSSGQQVFLKYGLMDNGSVWGHGGYLGPDFSALYLHRLSEDLQGALAQSRYNAPLDSLTSQQRASLDSEVAATLKENRYDAASGTLALTATEAETFQKEIERWRGYFHDPAGNGGLKADLITDPQALRQLTAFFAWAAWAAVANRPGELYSYTNNFPYDPLAGNRPTPGTLVWSVLSLIALLGGTALVLFAFGKFDYLGWTSKGRHVHPRMIPGQASASQKALVKYFVVVALLFLGQALIGGGVAHYRAEPGDFYGFDLSQILPSNLLRTWHLQTAIFWIATAYVAAALFLGRMLGGEEPRGQSGLVHLLFGAFAVVIFGSLLGEWAGIAQLFPEHWFWIGNQGWEFLELGRLWQILLVVGLVVWFGLLVRAVRPTKLAPDMREVGRVFLLAALAIPVFYVPAMFFDGKTNYTVVDTWRFWIIHLWVEGFFEFFATTIVAVIFLQLGITSRGTALRVIYLDAILYFAGGLIGTGHHWYFTGHTNLNLALSAVFSALEVVPLTLLTLDAWDFVKLTRRNCEVCGQSVAVPHKWTFYFLMAVGFWNFVGAGIFGFLLNLPIVSYYEVGTMLTPNHGHAALMGVFGMLAVGLTVFVLRQVSSDESWARLEKYLRVSFWGLNIGLAMMLVLSLFPGGVRQLWDVVENGYWHARSLALTATPLMRTLEWMRLPGDLVFIFLGAVPFLLAVLQGYWRMRRGSPHPAGGMLHRPAPARDAER
ncbi:nitric oxide reductase [Hypericibacter terrae]|uniref:Nitric oxide reductase n=1 Tax=Hypericibacter terrae TaxID=2602015 RepID=A0A5J6MGN5_9PROT|nr:cbb3-type cytochrome c oxidase subunit I [Hypericibacter terrae]QEX15420.1 nitric oxide reductase [Hypericibacter terrae]